MSAGLFWSGHEAAPLTLNCATDERGGSLLTNVDVTATMLPATGSSLADSPGVPDWPRPCQPWLTQAGEQPWSPDGSRSHVRRGCCRSKWAAVAAGRTSSASAGP